MNKELNIKWYFSSKGEYPESHRQVHIGHIDGHHHIGKFTEEQLRLWKNNQAFSNIYCWRYCDSLPPLPLSLKSNDNEFMEWFNKEYYAGLPEDDKELARQAWNAGQISLKKEKK